MRITQNPKSGNRKEFHFSRVDQGSRQETTSGGFPFRLRIHTEGTTVARHQRTDVVLSGFVSLHDLSDLLISLKKRNYYTIFFPLQYKQKKEEKTDRAHLCFSP